MKKVYALIALALALVISSGALTTGYCEGNGDKLRISEGIELPDIPAIEHKYTLKPYMPSDEVVMSTNNVELADTTHDKERNVTIRSYKSDDATISVNSDGGYHYTTANMQAVQSMLYYCVDAHNNFSPEGDWMVNTDEFEYMSAEQACELVADNLRAMYPDVWSSFDIELKAHAAHAEDMRKAVDGILSKYGSTQEQLDIYRNKHGLYDGCIADDDDYYFIESSWQLNGVQMLSDTVTLSSELSMEGPRMWAIVGSEGIVYVDMYYALYIAESTPCEPVSVTCEEVLANVDGFFKYIIGLEPIAIDRVELAFAPYPVASGEYELIPMLTLSAYDQSSGNYSVQMRVNALVGKVLTWA